jgi:Fe-S cluster biogenesis protein NfuA
MDPLVRPAAQGGAGGRDQANDQDEKGYVRNTAMRTQVEETIEAIRPALQADGGDIFLRDVDEASGVVSVTLVGACGTCPVSTDTLKAGIERIMRDRVDGVTEVVAV